MIELQKNSIRIEQKKEKSGKDILIIIGISLLIICIGLFALNQFLEFKYKVEFLKTPCTVCAELNKNQSKCVNACFEYKTTANALPNGDIKDALGNCYDTSGKIIACKDNLDININISSVTFNPD